MTTEHQSIIVYRNPAEAAIWESGFMAYLACGLLLIITCVIMFHGISMTATAIRRRMKRR